jgi:hypothetical protein
MSAWPSGCRRSVIGQLKLFLDSHRTHSGNPERGFIFRNALGNPLNLDALLREVIRPALEAEKIPWHGWHAFRRGLATNLHRLGVSDKVIQQILRHANVTTTINIYLKMVTEDAEEAMPRDPDVRIAVVFAAPFSASVLTLFYSTLSETPWRKGRGAVLEWREAHGGLIGSWIRGTLWAFFGLFFSFAAEVAFLFTLRFRDAHPPFAMLALPAYSPVFICWCWRKLHA